MSHVWWSDRSVIIVYIGVWADIWGQNDLCALKVKQVYWRQQILAIWDWDSLISIVDIVAPGNVCWLIIFCWKRLQTLERNAHYPSSCRSCTASLNMVAVHNTTDCPFAPTCSNRLFHVNKNTSLGKEWKGYQEHLVIKTPFAGILVHCAALCTLSMCKGVPLLAQAEKLHCKDPKDWPPPKSLNISCRLTVKISKVSKDPMLIYVADLQSLHIIHALRSGHRFAPPPMQIMQWNCVHGMQSLQLPTRLHVWYVHLITFTTLSTWCCPCWVQESESGDPDHSWSHYTKEI